MSVKNVLREISRNAFGNGVTAVAADILAIPVGVGLVAKTTGGDAEELALANGTEGEWLMIYLDTDGGGDGTLTPDTSTGWTSIVLRDAGDSVLLQYIDDTVGWIILGNSLGAHVAGAGYSVSRGVQTAASSALTASSTEVTLSTVTVAGADLQVGDLIHVVSQGIVTDANSTDTLTVKIKVGTELIITTGAVDVVDTPDDIWYIEAFITVRVLGSSGKLVGTGVVILDAIATAPVSFVLEEATEDISGDFDVIATGQWSTTNAGNSCRSDIFMVEVLR